MKNFFLRVRSFFVSIYLYFKKTLSLLFFILAAFVVLVFFSLQGEESHQNSCAKLGIECEKGLVHTLVDDTYDYSLKIFEKLKEKFKGESKERFMESHEKKKR